MYPMDLMIFDLDGTLAATGGDIASSVNAMLAAMGREPLSEDRVRSYVGDGVRQLIVRALGPEKAPRIEEGLALFTAHYDAHLLDTTVLYPGVTDVLEAFRDKRKIVLSNKRHAFTERIVAGLGILSAFDEVIGGDVLPYLKPDPRLVAPLLARYGIAPERTVIIGDGVNDILLARRSGIRSCAFLDGLTPREALLSLDPDDICERLTDLMTLYV